MSRSVSYLSYAETILYFTFENEFVDELDYDDFKSNLIYEIKSKLKSYYDVDEFDGRETAVILKNKLCKIGISEYCGLFSLSVAPIQFNVYGEDFTAFAENHCKQIKDTLEQCLENCGAILLNRLGTFSNGEGVFKRK